MHFEEMLNNIQEDEGIIYSDEQVEAIYEALNSGLYIITGGPGTGKTTILNAILKFLKMLFIITFFPSGGTGPALSFGCVCVRGMGCLHDTKGTLAWAQLSTFDCKLFVFFFF